MEAALTQRLWVPPDESMAREFFESHAGFNSASLKGSRGNPALDNVAAALCWWSGTRQLFELLLTVAARERLLRLRRAAEYGLRYYLYELPRGLDFSKRHKNGAAWPGSTGYSKISDRALREILAHAPFDEQSAFLDIGGGKAAAPVAAIRSGFRSAASLEIDGQLHATALKNIQRLGMADRIECIQGNALTFQDYAAYSHLFMHRPLDESLMTSLLSHLVETLETRERGHIRYFVIVYGRVPLKDIDEQLLQSKLGHASMVFEGRCSHRKAPIRIVELSFDTTD